MELSGRRGRGQEHPPETAIVAVRTLRELEAALLGLADEWSSARLLADVRYLIDAAEQRGRAL
jgi:hypothetical protein